MLIFLGTAKVQIDVQFGGSSYKLESMKERFVVGGRELCSSMEDKYLAGTHSICSNASILQKTREAGLCNLTHSEPNKINRIVVDRIFFMLVLSKIIAALQMFPACTLSFGDAHRRARQARTLSSLPDSFRGAAAASIAAVLSRSLVAAMHP
jgi:hypothetical protein